MTLWLLKSLSFTRLQTTYCHNFCLDSSTLRNVGHDVVDRATKLDSDYYIPLFSPVSLKNHIHHIILFSWGMEWHLSSRKLLASLNRTHTTGFAPSVKYGQTNVLSKPPSIGYFFAIHASLMNSSNDVNLEPLLLNALKLFFSTSLQYSLH